MSECEISTKKVKTYFALMDTSAKASVWQGVSVWQKRSQYDKFMSMTKKTMLQYDKFMSMTKKTMLQYDKKKPHYEIKKIKNKK